MNRQSILTVLLLAATCAQAQAYRWIDDKGRVQFGDAPPANAKSVKKTDLKTGVKTDASAEAPQQLPFEVLQAQKNFPVTLYTAPSCKEPCDAARAALNRRGVPFTEVLVASPETFEELKAKAGSETVPVLVVGRTVLSQFEQTGYDGLLDSSGYPKEGSVAPRNQRAPAPPSAKDSTPTKSTAAAKPGPYDTSGLKSNRIEKPGQYLTPGGTGSTK